MRDIRCLVIKMKLVFPQREMLFYVRQGYDEIFAKQSALVNLTSFVAGSAVLINYQHEMKGDLMSVKFPYN
ncbi:hypothetical protein T08_474 [Trichinella sp. T8]|nr:hypothetical protein T08_474 [Trichinella sp. T8]